MNDPLQPVFVAFAEWIRHVDSHLAKFEKLSGESIQRLRVGDLDTFANLLGTAQAEVANARQDLAQALARGMTPPSQS